VLRSIALVISVVFQPLVMPSLVFGLVFFSVPQSTSIPESIKLGLFYLVVLTTLVIPMLTIVGLRVSGMVKSLHMRTVEERTIPFLIVSIYYVLTTYFLSQKTELDPILWYAMGIISLSVVVLTMVTWFWKISA